MRIDRATRVRLLAGLMETLGRHPRLVKLLLRPVANLPVLANHMQVLTRAYLGATAFEIHDVDLERGTIAIGGVEEVMFGRKIVHLLHTVLGERLGEDAYVTEVACRAAGAPRCTFVVNRAPGAG